MVLLGGCRASAKLALLAGWPAGWLVLGKSVCVVCLGTNEVGLRNDLQIGRDILGGQFGSGSGVGSARGAEAWGVEGRGTMVPELGRRGDETSCRGVRVREEDGGGYLSGRLGTLTLVPAATYAM